MRKMMVIVMTLVVGVAEAKGGYVHGYTRANGTYVAPYYRGNGSSSSYSTSSGTGIPCGASYISVSETCHTGEAPTPAAPKTVLSTVSTSHGHRLVTYTQNGIVFVNLNDFATIHGITVVNNFGDLTLIKGDTTVHLTDNPTQTTINNAVVPFAAAPTNIAGDIVVPLADLTTAFKLQQEAVIPDQLTSTVTTAPQPAASSPRGGPQSSNGTTYKVLSKSGTVADASFQRLAQRIQMTQAFPGTDQFKVDQCLNFLQGRLEQLA